jgi:hypothetical protein
MPEATTTFPKTFPKTAVKALPKAFPKTGVADELRTATITSLSHARRGPSVVTSPWAVASLVAG